MTGLKEQPNSQGDKMTLSALKFSLATAALALGSQAFAATYDVDPAHSRVGFSVKHLMIATVPGNFNDFAGKFDFDPAKGELKSAEFTVQAASINTNNAKRDEHLRSPDFFDVAKYPTITLTNSKIKKAGKNKFKWTGDLNMHGVTKPVTFDLTYAGSMKGMMGEQRAGFEATGKINRKDFGLNWNKALEAGGVAVSDEVQMTIEVSAIEAKPESGAPAAAAKAAPAAASGAAPTPKK
jgi:polyisoprenoid-binding protein YceI